MYMKLEKSSCYTLPIPLLLAVGHLLLLPCFIEEGVSQREMFNEIKNSLRRVQCCNIYTEYEVNGL